MAAGKAGVVGGVDERGAHLREAVCGDAHADSAGAHENAEVGLMGADGGADGLGKVGVVDAFRPGGAEVGHGMPLAGEEFVDGFFELKSAVV